MINYSIYKAILLRLLMYEKILMEVLFCFSLGVIPKSVKSKHIKDNISLADFQLSEEDMEVLNSRHSNTRFCWDPTRVKWL